MSQSIATSFPADAVPQAPEDPLFGLMAAYRADTFDKKVDLGIGAYRDDNAKPWVLPVVKKVSLIKMFLKLVNDKNYRQTRSSAMTLHLTTNTSPSPVSRPSHPPPQNSS